MSLLRQLPFAITSGLTVVTLLLTMDYAIGPADDLAFLYDAYVEPLEDNVTTGQVVVGEEITLNLLHNENDLPNYIVLDAETPYVAAIDWIVNWQRDVPGVVEVEVGIEVFFEADGGRPYWVGTSPPPMFLEFDEPTLINDSTLQELDLTEPGLYFVEVFFRIGVDLPGRENDDEIEAVALREVMVMPPINAPTDAEQHASPLEPAFPALLLADWWAWTDHPCEVAAQYDLDDLIENCETIDRDDPEATLEVTFWALEIADDMEDQAVVATLIHQAGLLMLQFEDYDEAAGLFEEAAYLHGLNQDTQATAASLHNMGLAHLLSDDRDTAAGHAQQALALRTTAPNDAGTLLSLLLLLLALDDYELALDAAHNLAQTGYSAAPGLLDWLDGEVD